MWSLQQLIGAGIATRMSVGKGQRQRATEFRGRFDPEVMGRSAPRALETRASAGPDAESLPQMFKHVMIKCYIEKLQFEKFKLLYVANIHQYSAQ